MYVQVLLENVDSCPPEVLERINSLCEDQPSLTLYEHSQGEMFSSRDGTIHKDFRLFMTTCPGRPSAYKLSQAMENRVMTIHCPPLDALQPHKAVSVSNDNMKISRHNDHDGSDETQASGRDADESNARMTKNAGVLKSGVQVVLDEQPIESIQTLALIITRHLEGVVAGAEICQLLARFHLCFKHRVSTGALCLPPGQQQVTVRSMIHAAKMISTQLKPISPNGLSTPVECSQQVAGSSDCKPAASVVDSILHVYTSGIPSDHGRALVVKDLQELLDMPDMKQKEFRVLQASTSKQLESWQIDSQKLQQGLEALKHSAADALVQGIFEVQNVNAQRTAAVQVSGHMHANSCVACWS